MRILKPVLLGILAVLLCACAAMQPEIRRYMPRSPHRQVAILPFEVKPDQKDIGTHTADIMEVKMGRLNFIISDRQSIRAALPSPGAQGSFDDLKAAADFGRKMGVQAVLLGIIDEAYERVGNTSPVLVSAVAIRLRLVDVASGRVIWQGIEKNRLEGWKLYDVLNKVTDALIDRMANDFVKHDL